MGPWSLLSSLLIVIYHYRFYENYYRERENKVFESVLKKPV
jgi:hypothetical protein